MGIKQNGLLVTSLIETLCISIVTTGQTSVFQFLYRNLDTDQKWHDTISDPIKFHISMVLPSLVVCNTYWYGN